MTTELEKLIEESRWRDIREAPKDGRDILVYASHSGVLTVGHWDDMLWTNDTPPGFFPLFDATHFRPLPDDRLAEACRVLLDAAKEVSGGTLRPAHYVMQQAIKAAEQIAKVEG